MMTLDELFVKMEAIEKKVHIALNSVNNVTEKMVQMEAKNMNLMQKVKEVG